MSDPDATPSTQNWLVAVGIVDPSVPFTVIQLDSGQVVSLPTTLLTMDSTMERQEAPQATGNITVPVLSEELVIGKRKVPIETVRLTRSVETRTEKVHVPLLKEHWEITRTPRNEEVPERYGVRQDAGLTVYPVFEERVVTRTALYLVEELQVQKVTSTTDERIEETLQRDVISVERLEP